MRQTPHSRWRPMGQIDILADSISVDYSGSPVELASFRQPPQLSEGPGNPESRRPAKPRIGRSSSRPRHGVRRTGKLLRFSNSLHFPYGVSTMTPHRTPTELAAVVISSQVFASTGIPFSNRCCRILKSSSPGSVTSLKPSAGGEDLT
jgi:hypothetical protein